MNFPKVIIIGLDSVPPSTAFEFYREYMPNLERICLTGIWGPLRSTDPPITVPAWVSMTSGQSPGQLGIYGFRNRIQNSRSLELVLAKHINPPRIWNYMAAAKRHSVVVSVPLTYPVTPNPYLHMTSGFLTPSSQSNYTGNPHLKKELESLFGPYIVDVDDFRSPEKERIARACHRFTSQHFSIFRHLVKTKQPEFAMLVDLGPDRMHHALLRHIMPSHPNYQPSDIGVEYYSLLDKEIGETLQLAGPDTLVMVVSDHGVKPLLGAVCINELLIQHGFLTVQNRPDTPTPLSKTTVDWSQTKAWGEGGYYGRIFLNIKGREPGGILKSHQVDSQVRKLKELFHQLKGPTGEKMKNRVFTADELYKPATKMPPDLTIYFDDLSYRSAGTVGNKGIFRKTNDTGPDDANHDYDGILAMTQGNGLKRRRKDRFQILDVFATAMHRLKIEPNPKTAGKIIE